MATVSVVIPSRNDAVMLNKCLALLSLQARPADEGIVVDNASADETADVCRAAGVKRIPVDLQGIPATAAAGFDAAAGDIIARLDTDSGLRPIGLRGWKPFSWCRGRCPLSRDPVICAPR